jgi:hypothetical protein
MRLDEDDGTNNDKAKRSAVALSDLDCRKHFPKLRQLSIRFVIRDSPKFAGPYHCCYDPKVLARLGKLLDRAEMEWKADTVKMNFDMNIRRYIREHDAILDGLGKRTTRQCEGSQVP